jgi:type IV fimbrial biogenesis protein FimT
MKVTAPMLDCHTRQPRWSARRPCESGVTLIELIVTITIAAILVALAGPSYKSITTSNRIASEINGLLGDLQFARSEAIKEGQTIIVCASTDGVNCSGSTNWKTGWVVFFDANGNSKVDSPGETALRIQTAFNGTDSFQANKNLVSISFNREGIATGIANGTLITLHDSSASSNWTRCLSINLIGQLTVQKYGDVLNGGTCT